MQHNNYQVNVARPSEDMVGTKSRFELQIFRYVKDSRSIAQHNKVRSHLRAQQSLPEMIASKKLSNFDKYAVIERKSKVFDIIERG